MHLQLNPTGKLFKLLFKIPFLKKRHFGFYKRVFKPLALFKRQTAICRYGKEMKVKVNIDEWIQQQIYFFGSWDEPGTNFIKNHLKKEDIFIDIGANIGSYSLIASELVGEGGSVHAFEPIAGVYERLLFNIELNNLKNIVVNKKAIYEKSGTLNFYVSANENLGMSSIFHHDTESGKTETVEGISLDEYIFSTGINRVDMIKIDIEGAELFALKGMIKVLSVFKPLILMEVSDELSLKSHVKSMDIIDFMKGLNYTMNGLSVEGFPVDFKDNRRGNYTNCVFMPN